MDLNVKRFNSTPLEYLSEDQMGAIHAAALDILQDCGTMIHHQKSLDLLHQAGAHVKDDNHVFIPSGLVEAAIRSAPSRVTIYDRNGAVSMCLEGRNVYYGTGSDCPYLLDSFSGERREFLSADVEDAVRLVDALPNIDFTMSNGLAPDFPAELQYQYKYAIMIRNSTKPQVITAADKTCLNDIADIAAAAVGGREELSRKPIFVLYDEPTSPLVHDVGYLEFGLTYSFDLLVMCNEFIGQVRRMMEGITVDKENLAVECVKRVGPGGHFLGDVHTLNHFRENWQPDLTDRRTYQDWQSRGAKSMGQLAKEKIKELKKSHQPQPLSPEVEAQIDKILKRAKG